MLRAVIRKNENGGWNDADRESFYTVDFEAPALEVAWHITYEDDQRARGASACDGSRHG